MAECRNRRVAFQNRVRADASIATNGDGTQTQFTVFNACILEIDRIADAGTVANHQQVGRAQGDRTDHHIPPDPRSQCAQPPRVERRATKQIRRR